jgi:hypothetical protein
MLYLSWSALLLHFTVFASFPATRTLYGAAIAAEPQSTGMEAARPMG